MSSSSEIVLEHGSVSEELRFLRSRGSCRGNVTIFPATEEDVRKSLGRATELCRLPTDITGETLANQTNATTQTPRFIIDEADFYYLPDSFRYDELGERLPCPCKSYTKKIPYVLSPTLMSADTSDRYIFLDDSHPSSCFICSYFSIDIRKRKQTLRDISTFSLLLNSRS